MEQRERRLRGDDGYRSVDLIAKAAALQGRFRSSYLIYSEVSYTFTPAVPWILQGGITLSD